MIATGVCGAIELVFARRGSRTVLARSRAEAPMTLVRPFPLPDERLAVQLITIGPGLCGGDTVAIDVTVEEGARVLVTTTAASRVLSMDEDSRAVQHVSLHAADEALLEYYPGVTIPFPDSDFRQTVQVSAAATARVGVVESWALGRAARGEHLQFRRISSRTSFSVDGTLRYLDATELEPRGRDLASAALLAGYSYVASGFWYGADLPGRDQAAPAADGDVLSAFAQSSPGLVYLRALGRDAPAMDAVLRESTETISGVWGYAPVRVERFKC